MILRPRLDPNGQAAWYEEKEKTLTKGARRARDKEISGRPGAKGFSGLLPREGTPQS